MRGARFTAVNDSLAPKCAQDYSKANMALADLALTFGRADSSMWAAEVLARGSLTTASAEGSEPAAS